jgi:hypothetical protein
MIENQCMCFIIKIDDNQFTSHFHIKNIFHLMSFVHYVLMMTVTAISYQVNKAFAEMKTIYFLTVTTVVVSC